MKYTKRCPCCDHVVAAYTFTLNEDMMRAFVRLAELFIPRQKTARTEEARGVTRAELDLNNSQYGNLSTLRHFGLIYQPRKGGAVFLTLLGVEFYLGRATVLTPAAHMGGDTLPPDHPAWRTHKGDRRRVFIRDVLPDEYKQRPEFQAEKSGQAQFSLA